MGSHALREISPHADHIIQLGWLTLLVNLTYEYCKTHVYLNRQGKVLTE